VRKLGGVLNPEGCVTCVGNSLTSTLLNNLFIARADICLYVYMCKQMLITSCEAATFVNRP